MGKATINLAFLQGIVASDPVSISQNGKNSVAFTLKTYSSFGPHGDDIPIRHDIEIKDQNNGLFALQFIRKNMMVMIQGTIYSKNFKDKNNNWHKISKVVNAYNYPIMIIETDATFREPQKPMGYQNPAQQRYVQQNYTHTQQPIDTQPQVQQQYPQQQMQQQVQQPDPQMNQIIQQLQQQIHQLQQQQMQQQVQQQHTELEPPPYDDTLEF